MPQMYHQKRHRATKKGYDNYLNAPKGQQQKSFQDEFIAFLKKYHVEYDERYIWDQAYAPSGLGLLLYQIHRALPCVTAYTLSGQLTINSMVIWNVNSRAEQKINRLSLKGVKSAHNTKINSMSCFPALSEFISAVIGKRK